MGNANCERKMHRSNGIVVAIVLSFLFFLGWYVLSRCNFYEAAAVFGELESFDASAETSSDPWIKNFLDIIIAVYCSLDIGYLAASITLFALLRSTLERTQDENPLMEAIIREFRDRTVQSMISHIFYCIIGLLFGIVYYLFFIHLPPVGCAAIISLVCLAVFFLFLTGNAVWVWWRCIVTSRQYCNIAEQHWRHAKESMQETLAEKNIPLSECPQTQDAFVLLLSKIDQLLLTNDPHLSGNPLDFMKIATILQERWFVFRPLVPVLEQLRIHPSGGSIWAREQMLQNRTSDQAWEAFAEQMLRLYRDADCCRKIILSSFRGDLTLSTEEKHGKIEQVVFQPAVEGRAAALLWQEVIHLFVSCTRISDFTYNGATFRYANFFNTRMECCTFYGAEFLETIFAYAQLKNVTLDMSDFFVVSFEHMQLLSSGLSNARFKDCAFSGAISEDSNFSHCLFRACRFSGVSMAGCVLNDCVFQEMLLKDLSFSDCELGNWNFLKTDMENCSFERSQISAWMFSGNRKRRLVNCSFSESVLIDFSVSSADMSSSNFTKAVLPGMRLQHVELPASLFPGASLPFSVMQVVNLSNSDLSDGNLYRGKWTNVTMPNSNLLCTRAQGLSIRNCNFKACNCGDSDWSNMVADQTNFVGARLNGCRLMGAKLTRCDLQNVLAENLQLTDANCSNVQFAHSTLTGSNLSGSKFMCCQFDFADMTELGAAQTTFEGCSFSNADFSGTRFIQAEWTGSKTVIRNAKFTGCVFINCNLESIVFQNCNLQAAVFEPELPKEFFVDCLMDQEKEDNQGCK